jgi:hypothetical protein
LLGISDVVFGGDYLKLGDILFDGIKNSIPNIPYMNFNIMRSTLKESASTFGSLIIGREKILEEELV